MARVCLFDVNETLLDLGALDPHFERAFGDAGVRRSWFLQVLQSALLATVTGAYSDFGAVGAAGPGPRAARPGGRPSAAARCLPAPRSALVPPATGASPHFGAVGAAALDMTAERQGVRLSEEDRRS